MSFDCEARCMGCPMGPLVSPAMEAEIKEAVIQLEGQRSVFETYDDATRAVNELRIGDHVVRACVTRHIAGSCSDDRFDPLPVRR